MWQISRSKNRFAFTVSGHRRQKRAVAKLPWAGRIVPTYVCVPTPSGPLQAYSAPAVTPSGAFFDLLPRLGINRGRGSSQCRSESCSTPKQNPTDPDHRSETDERQKLD